MKKIWKYLGLAAAVSALIPCRVETDEETGVKTYQSLLSKVKVGPGKDGVGTDIRLSLLGGVVPEACGISDDFDDDIDQEDFVDDFDDDDFADLELDPTDADDAQAIADEAQAMADEAQAAADEAQAMADEAQAAADEAQAMADEIKAAADEAKTTADETEADAEISE